MEPGSAIATVTKLFLMLLETQPHDPRKTLNNDNKSLEVSFAWTLAYLFPVPADVLRSIWTTGDTGDREDV